MTFAKYRGANNQLGFTPGKIYYAWGEVDTEVVSYLSMDVVNDQGKYVKVFSRIPGDDSTFDFEFFQEVYAVVIKAVADFEVGEVVTLDDVDTYRSNNGDRVGKVVYSVLGEGFIQSENLLILDGTNVLPGIKVLHCEIGIWERIKVVDECLWIKTTSIRKLTPLDDFIFAVDKDGDVKIEPSMICVDNTASTDELTIGNSYRAIQMSALNGPGMDLVTTLNDYREIKEYLFSRFIF